MLGMNFVRLSIVILLLHSVGALSEEYGTVAGVISSELGIPLPGYRVSLVQELYVLRTDSGGRDSIRIEGTEFITTTDSLGEYTLILPPGRYTWEVRGDFHTAHGLEGLRVLPGSKFP